MTRRHREKSSSLKWLLLAIFLLAGGTVLYLGLTEVPAPAAKAERTIPNATFFPES